MVAFLRAIAVIAANLAVIRAECTNPLKRRAWHTFTDAEKKEYIDAELCIMEQPVRIGLPACRSLFDELQANHQIQAASVHGVGAFLPYHRLVLHVHEQFMRELCGYTGAQPYWDEPMDAGNFSSSIIFDPDTGFGGDGRESDGCITDGPFANYTNALGPGYLITDHCINRAIDDEVSKGSYQFEVDNCYKNTTFETAWPCIEEQPHLGGHAGTGGQMADAIASPGDPLFYLHHTWLDKVWWDWQALDLPHRLTDMGGRNRREEGDSFAGTTSDTGSTLGNGTCGGFSNCSNTPPEIAGDPGNTTTLTHVLSTLDLVPNVTIADVMDIQGGYLCYEYV